MSHSGWPEHGKTVRANTLLQLTDVSLGRNSVAVERYFENEFCFAGVGANRARTRRRKSPAPNRTLPTRTNVPDSDKDPKKVIRCLASSGIAVPHPKVAIYKSFYCNHLQVTRVRTWAKSWQNVVHFCCHFSFMVHGAEESACVRDESRCGTTRAPRVP